MTRLRRQLPKFYNKGKPTAPILVVCDSPSPRQFQTQQVMDSDDLDWFYDMAQAQGINRDDLVFVTPCPSIPGSAFDSDARRKKFIMGYHDEFFDYIEKTDPEVIVCLGKTALQQVTAKPQKITKVRGRVQMLWGEIPVLPMFAPSYARSMCQEATLETDIRHLGAIKANDWGIDVSTDIEEAKYKFCFDLEPYIDEIERMAAEGPVIVAFDTETTGLEWYRSEVFPFLVQISYKEGHALVVPVYEGYIGRANKHIPKLRSQLKRLMENPDIEKAGHNVTFDIHMLNQIDIYPRNVTHDTQLLCFTVDDNMQVKSLSEAIKRFVPEMAGYSDEFDSSIDKSDMMSVDPRLMLRYAGGDADATLRLFNVLLAEALKDPKNFNVYEKVRMPATLCFGTSLERNGLPFSESLLDKFEQSVNEEEDRLYKELIQRFSREAKNPKKIIRKHLSENAAKVKKEGERRVLSFTRDRFVRDVFFSKDGYNLKPKVFTKSTKRLDEGEKIPSLSAKDHLPYFEAECPFVTDYIAYKKILTMRSNFISGIRKYIHHGTVFPSYRLDNTATGRASSERPNGQNIPKRGKIAKDFRSCIEAPYGHVLIQADLSQAELRMVAWKANERNMIAVYNEGGDLHKETAAATMGLTVEDFDKLSADIAAYKRFCAKAVNFGNIYGISAEGFMVYAKTTYGVEYTLGEAKKIQDAFFDAYPNLKRYHQAQKALVRKHGFVRANHGAIRRLPSIYSKDRGIVSMTERQAINSPIQSISSDLGLMAMIRFCRDADRERYRCIGFIHDAIVLLSKEEHAEECMSSIKWLMENPPLKEWFGLEAPLPIGADVEVGWNLGELSECEDVQAIRPEWFREELDREDQCQFIC